MWSSTYHLFHLHVQFNDMVNVLFSSKAFVGGVVAYVLDNTLHRHDSVVRKDRGYHWWDKFRSYRTDTRSEEFYSLPFNLNKFFPSVWAYHVISARYWGYLYRMFPLLWKWQTVGPTSLGIWKSCVLKQDGNPMVWTMSFIGLLKSPSLC